MKSERNDLNKITDGCACSKYPVTWKQNVFGDKKILSFDELIL